MNTTSTPTRPLNFLFNAAQAVLGRGGQIDWSKVGAYFYAKGKFTVKLNGAAAAGADELTVDALSHPLTKGTNLDFGRYAPVTVTVNDADVNAGETGITVVALPGPIPAGTILKFSGSGAGFAKVTADAAAAATALVVEALPEDIDNAATADYPGGPKNAEVTEDVAAGATTVPVEPLPFDLDNDAEAIADYTGSGDKRMIPAGTVMARTDDDLLIPRRDATDETATEILQSDAQEGALKDAKSGYGTLIEAQVYENLLPDADDAGDIPAGYKTEMATNGGRFNYSDWNDDRASE